MLAESPACVAKLVRWGSNQLRVQNGLRWCPECASADIRRIGFSYWHLAHQIPAVSACAFHGCELLVSVLPSSGWDTICDLPHETGFVRAGQDEQRFAWFTCNALKLLLAAKELKYIQPQYNRAAIRLGLFTKAGNLRRIRLLEAMKTWWLAPLSQNSELSQKSLFKKIAKLFQGQQFQSQHIVTNLLVLSNVFENAEESFGAEPAIKVENTCDPKNSFGNERLYHPQQIEGCAPLKGARKPIVKSQNYVKRLAITGSLKACQPPAKLQGEMVMRLMTKAKAGYSSQDIARGIDVKKSYVESCLGCSPETQKFRKLLTMRRRQIQHRTKITEQVHTSLNQSRTEIAKKQSAAFHWLYRHDRQWLYKVLPPARKPIKPVRVDWAARDEELLSRIRNLSNKKITPKSWAQLDKVIGGCSWFSKYRHKLPKSVSLAARHMGLPL